MQKASGALRWLSNHRRQVGAAIRILLEAVRVVQTIQEGPDTEGLPPGNPRTYVEDQAQQAVEELGEIVQEQCDLPNM